MLMCLTFQLEDSVQVRTLALNHIYLDVIFSFSYFIYKRKIIYLNENS